MDDSIKAELERTDEQMNKKQMDGWENGRITRWVDENMKEEPDGKGEGKGMIR